MLRTRKPLVVLAIVGAIGLAGCGDDDDEATTGPTTPIGGPTGATGDSGVTGVLPADVVAEGNEVCAQGNKEVGQLLGGVSHNANPEEFEHVVVEEVVPNIQGQIDAIRGLDDSEELQSALDQAEEIVNQIEGEPDILIQADEDPFAEVSDEFNALGLNKCAD